LNDCIVCLFLGCVLSLSSKGKAARAGGLRPNTATADSRLIEIAVSPTRQRQMVNEWRRPKQNLRA
jgi:hypothetical protein